MDIAALSIIAGKERSSSDWQGLVERVGGGLQIANIYTNHYSAFGLVILSLI
jgi:hypothetical protein